MDYSKIIMGMKRYGSTEADICLHGLSVMPEQIRQSVILAPSWQPSTLPALGEATLISSPSHIIKVWDIKAQTKPITFITSGIGAPMLLEALLPLGLTPCERILFIGSVGALDPAMGIGDIVLPEYSVCGDGASRYIACDDLTEDVFGQKAYPDAGLLALAAAETERLCREHAVKWHMGKNFSIDTIAAQFAHIDQILALECNVIEMETAAAFRAAALMQIPMIALFSVSDNTLLRKSLISGRTPEERQYRKHVRCTLFPQLIEAICRH